jgi:hypothetical protein
MIGTLINSEEQLMTLQLYGELFQKGANRIKVKERLQDKE